MIGDKVEKVVLVVKDGNNWKTVDAKLNGKQITANFAAEGPVFVYVKTASSAGGQSPSTGVTSSAWMIMLAVAVMAVILVVLIQRTNKQFSAEYKLSSN